MRETIIGLAKERIRAAVGPHYRRIINATGVILHSGLGRAVLAERALRQIQEEMAGYSLLQVDVETGKRSRRDERIQWLLQQLTGCEAACVVNNNAAATAIALNTLARGREVIVSRGQLIEIGGEFRLPDVMAQSGSKMVEVGATNRTHPRDYERAITDQTAAIFRAHPSNYRIVGFTEEVPIDQLAAMPIVTVEENTLLGGFGSAVMEHFEQIGELAELRIRRLGLPDVFIEHAQRDEQRKAEHRGGFPFPAREHDRRWQRGPRLREPPQ